MQNLTQVLYRTYIEAPRQIAVNLLYSRQPEEVLTYQDLLISAVRYSLALQKAGVQPGEVVILILHHGKDLLSAFFGAILSGAIPSIMPFLTEKLLPDQYRLSLNALFEITEPSAIITYTDFVDEVRNTSQHTSVRCVLVSDQISNEIDSKLENPDDFYQACLKGLDRLPDEVVFLQHSSGTTGLQKGVALSHLAVFNQLESYSQALKLGSTDVIVSWLPLYHDMGLIAGLILPILMRNPLVLMSPFDWVRAPYRLMQAISQYHGTLCWLPNFAYNFCAQKIRDRDLEGVDLSTLRAVTNCSEPVHWKSQAMFLERFMSYGLLPEALATSYAMAENVFAVTQGGIDKPVTIDRINQEVFLNQQVALPVKADPPDGDNNEGLPALLEAPTIQMLSAGFPIQGTRLRILDTQGKDLPERHIGEIVLQSNCMLTGYYHRPDLTEKIFLNGWYMTGDLGSLVAGELFVTGRKKDLIIVGGKNVYPQDLERLASEVEGVHPGRVVAFGVFNEQAGTEEVVIIAEADLDTSEQLSAPGNARTAEKIATEIRQKVTRGSDIALRYVYIVGRNWLVKTSSGKIARSANRVKYLTEYGQ